MDTQQNPFNTEHTYVAELLVWRQWWWVDHLQKTLYPRRLQILAIVHALLHQLQTSKQSAGFLQTQHNIIPGEFLEREQTVWQMDKCEGGINIHLDVNEWEMGRKMD